MADNEIFLKSARAAAALETDIPMDELYVVWFAKTLKNWKALVASDHPRGDGQYIEVTYNGEKGEAYVDIYEKLHNSKVPNTKILSFIDAQ